MNKRIISIILVMLFAVSTFSTITFAAPTLDASVPSSVRIGSNFVISGTANGTEVVVRIINEAGNDIKLFKKVSVIDNKYSLTTAFNDNDALGNYNIIVTDSDKVEVTKVIELKKKSGGVPSTVDNSGYGNPSPSPSPSVSPSPSPSVSPSASPSASPSVKPTKKFKDLAGYDWAEEPIEALASRGIINGMSEDTFAPAETVTRAQFAKMIVGFFDKVEVASSAFADVKEGDWFYEYVGAAAALGITNGDDSGNFNPNATISREDMCVMLQRAGKKAGLQMPSATLSFADSADVSDYAKDAVASFAQLGVVNGKGDNKFEPKQTATRAEAAKVIYLVFVKLLGK